MPIYSSSLATTYALLCHTLQIVSFSKSAFKSKPTYWTAYSSLHPHVPALLGAISLCWEVIKCSPYPLVHKNFMTYKLPYLAFRQRSQSDVRNSLAYPKTLKPPILTSMCRLPIIACLVNLVQIPAHLKNTRALRRQSATYRKFVIKIASSNQRQWPTEWH